MEYLKGKLGKINFYESQEGEKTPKFLIRGNAGSRMSFDSGDVVINLAGDIRTKKDGFVPILYGHDWDSQVGHADGVEVSESGIDLQGIVSVESDRSKQFVSSSRKGFQWEASLGFSVLKGREIRKGENCTVNGRVEEGPVTIADAIEIWECSVVLFGADANTASTITAKKEEDMSEEKKNPELNEATTTKTPEVEAGKKGGCGGGGCGVQSTEVEAAAKKAIEEANAAVENARNMVINENKRLDALKEIRDKYGDSEHFEAAAREGWSADKYELTVLRASRNNVPGPYRPEKGIDKKAVEVAFLRAAGVCKEDKYSEQVLEAADSLRGADFRDIVEAATGFCPTTAQRRNTEEYYHAAFTTTDLGSVFVNNANTILLNSLGVIWDNWKSIFKVTSVTDFKNQERWRLGSNFTFDEIGEGDEMKTGTMTDERMYTIKPKSYGTQFNIGYQTLVNGDTLNVFGDLVNQIARGAARRINDECWKLFLNPHDIDVTGSSKSFFHADHENLVTGKPLSLENIGEVRRQFFLKHVGHKAYNGKDMANMEDFLNLTPTILLVPTALEDKANMLLKATHFGNVRPVTTPEVGATEELMPIDVNPQAGRWQVVAVPELGFSKYGGAYSDTTWYMLANPGDLAAFEIAFLNGQQTPMIRQADWQLGRLGMQFDASIHFGVAQGDERPITKSLLKVANVRARSDSAYLLQLIN